MKLKTLLLLVGLVLSGSAFASNCPNLMAEIDKALAEDANMEQSVREQAIALRNEGEVLHKAGKHDESVEKLNQALDLLDEG